MEGGEREINNKRGKIKEIKKENAEKVLSRWNERRDQGE
jgi:hypothetical protein